MKPLRCELCGSVDFVTSEGYMTCRYCRTKYTPKSDKNEKADERSEISAIDCSQDLESILTSARKRFEDKDYFEAYSLYSQAFNIDPDNPRVVLISGVLSGWMNIDGEDVFTRALNGYKKALAIKIRDNKAASEFNAFAFYAIDVVKELMIAVVRKREADHEKARSQANAVFLFDSTRNFLVEAKLDFFKTTLAMIEIYLDTIEGNIFISMNDIALLTKYLVNAQEVYKKGKHLDKINKAKFDEIMIRIENIRMSLLKDGGVGTRYAAQDTKNQLPPPNPNKRVILTKSQLPPPNPNKRVIL